MDEKKRVITVCTGTTCYVMGGAELVDELERALDAGEIEARLEGSTCFGNCKAQGGGRPPYVKVGERVIEAGSLDAVKQQLGLKERRTVDGPTE
jgi:NADH:ubiquinone oxidoreductase subunit E